VEYRIFDKLTIPALQAIIESMKREAYAAARIVSPTVHAYFARRLEKARARGAGRLASLPSEETIEAMIDAAFWASLRREEGYSPRISLAFLSPLEAGEPLLFERAMSLAPAPLTRVAPAVERHGIHLGVWNGGDELHVWGATRTIPPYCLVLEVAAPGLLVVKHHSGEEEGKFVNVALLEGDLIKVVDEHASEEPECPQMLTSLLGFESPASWAHSVNVLVRLAVSMREHGRGGCLLVVPAGSELWRESIVSPVSYAVSPPFANLARTNAEDSSSEELARTIDWVAGLTAVDGAVIMNDRYELLGFGAKIARRRGSPVVEQITLTEPIQGHVAELMHPEELGGTRHFSAAQFVYDQHDAIALVASQDGHFTIFEWSPCEQRVRGHRVEALLM
jgi:hypothetical protein